MMRQHAMEREDRHEGPGRSETDVPGPFVYGTAEPAGAWESGTRVTGRIGMVRQSMRKAFLALLRISGTVLCSMPVSMSILSIFWEPYVDAWHDMPGIAMLSTMTVFVSGYALMASVIWILRGRPHRRMHMAEMVGAVMIGMDAVIAFLAWGAFVGGMLGRTSMPAFMAMSSMVAIALVWGEVWTISRICGRARRETSSQVTRGGLPESSRSAR